MSITVICVLFIGLLSNADAIDRRARRFADEEGPEAVSTRGTRTLSRTRFFIA
jgi:hypothetical protein